MKKLVIILLFSLIACREQASEPGKPSSQNAAKPETVSEPKASSVVDKAPDRSEPVETVADQQKPAEPDPEPVKAVEVPKKAVVLPQVPAGVTVVKALPKEMPTGTPRRFKIVPDGSYVFAGHTADGRQYFITTPFDSDKEMLAAFLWNKAGEFEEVWLYDLGPRSKLDRKDAQKKFAGLKKAMGTSESKAIEVAPCQVECWGIQIGFFYEREGDYETLALEPGNYMIFMPPWDGSYDT